MKDTSQPLDPNKLFTFFEIKPAMKIADFGAGAGFNLFKAAYLAGRKGVVYALDIKKSVVEHLKKEVKERGINNIQVIWTNLELVNQNPIPPSSLDMVLIITTLYMSIKHKEILKEAYRVLKGGGSIVIVDWKKEKTPIGPPIDERVDLEKIKEIAYTLLLNRVKEFEPSKYHFGIIFRK